MYKKVIGSEPSGLCRDDSTTNSNAAIADQAQKAMAMTVVVGRLFCITKFFWIFVPNEAEVNGCLVLHTQH